MIEYIASESILVSKSKLKANPNPLTQFPKWITFLVLGECLTPSPAPIFFSSICSCRDTTMDEYDSRGPGGVGEKVCPSRSASSLYKR